MAEIAAGAARGKRIEIWFEDEARIGQKNKITRRWAKRGTRPSAPHDQRTRSAYIFGAICPKLGKAAALVMPWCDTYAMTQHLAEIARHVDDDAHAILIMDQAGWHMSNNLVVPENITILPLPPKSPELNPVENLWHFMRDNWLSNRVFKSYDDIVDHCCDAWRKPHRFSPWLGRITPAMPRHVKRAIEFMIANIAEPLTLDKIAAVSGVSERALQMGFRQFKMTTPMAYLRYLRLEAMHQDLKGGQPGMELKEVGLRWGFLHMGRMAAEYRSRYGELPSETYKRAHGMNH